MLRVLLCAAALMAAISTGTNASTVEPSVKTVALDKSLGWYQFRFDINMHGGIWLDAEADPKTQPLSALEFDVHVTEKSTLQVTDAFRWGDVFEVFANGVSLGSTSKPAALATTNEYDYFNDFDAAISDAEHNHRWSFSEFHLDAGHYTIKGYVIEMPEARGRGALQLIDFAEDSPVAETVVLEETATPVPLPGTLPLLLGAGAVWFSVSRRRAIGQKG